MARFSAFLLAASCTLSATAVAELFHNVEVDVVFPRNETYAPTPVFPLVFAIQNLAAASPIGPLNITWVISKLGPDPPLPFFGEHSVSESNSKAPQYINLWTAELDGPESAGTYDLWWQVSYYACSGKDKTNPGLSFGSRQDNFTFTIDPSAQQPNLAADLDACATQNATIPINVETWPLNPEYYDREVCGVVLDAPVEAYPCAVRLDSAAASSIAAEVMASASACAASPSLASGCPTPRETQDSDSSPSTETQDNTPATETKDSSGSRGPVWSGLGMFTGSLLAGLLLLIPQ